MPKSILKGTLYIVAAPSGGGKTSLVRALIGTTKHLCVSVSHTTRPMREGEKEGVHYHFVEQSEFAALKEQGVFLEHATVFGNSYGTSRLWVQEQLDKGEDVILEIDWQGAQQVRKLMPEATSIFIVPPSLEVLKQRLYGRGTDSDEVLAGRMAQALDEMSHYAEFDYLIVNDDFDHALLDLRAVIRSRRVALPFQQEYERDLLTDLLKDHQN
ncbi:guanylate kinase [Endozoicomonadaceae bacterium StTr2]